jgi:hypothetical protein
LTKELNDQCDLLATLGDKLGELAADRSEQGT